MTKEQFREALETYCTLTGASVTSYGRSPWHNEIVGGAAYSAHQFWLAADVRQWEHLTGEEQEHAIEFFAGPPPEHFKRNDRDRGDVAARVGLRLIVEDDHDHLQPLDWRKG
jgi:hypothetical protein